MSSFTSAGEPSPRQRGALGRSNLLSAGFPSDQPGLHFLCYREAAADVVKVEAEVFGFCSDARGSSGSTDTR